MKYTTKGFFERYAINCLAELIDNRYRLLSHQKEKSPDWIGDESFSCGVEVTRAINKYEGECYRFVADNFGKQLSNEVLNDNLDRAIPNFHGVLEKWDKYTIFSDTKGSINHKMPLIRVKEAVEKKIVKLNGNYRKFISNELFVYIEKCEYKSEEIEEMISKIDFSKHIIVFDKIYFLDFLGLNIYESRKERVRKLEISKELRTKLNTISDPNLK